MFCAPLLTHVFLCYIIQRHNLPVSQPTVLATKLCDFLRSAHQQRSPSCFGDTRENASSATPRKNKRLIAGCNASLYTTVKNLRLSERNHRKRYAVFQPLAPTGSLTLEIGRAS